MAKLFRATIISSRHGTCHEIAGEFEDSEWNSLIQFAEYEEELSKTEFVAARMPLAGETNWSQERGWQLPTLPSAPVVRDLLMMLRPFLLQVEPTNFYKVLKIVSRRYGNTDLRANLQVLKDSFGGKNTTLRCR
jgi:hypothetical protein